MTDKRPKIILAHPGRQHSFRVAKALKESGMLFKYITTVYNKDDSLFMKFAKVFLDKNNLLRAKKRKCEVLDDSDVQLFNELWGYLLLLVLRLDKSRFFYVLLNNRIKNSFGKKVARYAIKHKVDAVICYDANSEVCFKYLERKAPHIIRIMDNAAVARNYLFKIFEKSRNNDGDFVKTYQSYNYLIDKESSETFTIELKLANVHIVASSFAEKSLFFNGISEQNIIKAPYGVDLDKFIPILKTEFDKINILFVGSFDQRKGIRQVLETAKEINNPKIIFNLIGSGKNTFPELFNEFSSYVNFINPLPFHKMPIEYAQNDLFIFPSFGDGFGLVILEALAAGLPVIASENCAGPDLVRDGENGFIIEAGNTAQLKEKILWFAKNPSELQRMKANAIETASRYTWEKYEKNLVNGLISKLYKADG